MRKSTLKKFKQWVSQVTRDFAWVTKWLTKSSLAWDCSDSSMCFSCDLSRVVSRKPIMNSPSSQIFTKLSHSNLTLNPTKNIGKWLNKKHSCKSQLYNFPIWLFRDKTPKHTLELKHEFGNRGKTHSHLNLKPVKNLHHIYTCILKHLHITNNFIKFEASRNQGMYIEQVKCNQVKTNEIKIR